MAPELNTQVLAAVDKARVNPVWFFETILNVKQTELDTKRGDNWNLDPWQIELIEAVADVWRAKNNLPTLYNHDGLNKITVRAMHGPGKTFGVAGIMHWFNFVFKGLIVCTAPKEKQLRTRLWPSFRKIAARAGAQYSSLLKIDATKIVWCNDEDWVAHAETARSPENIAGYHGSHILFVVDEASGIKEELFPAIEGAVSTGIISIIILIGNPTKNTGTFYNSHCTTKVSKNYYQLHVDISKTKRVSASWIKEMAEKYGEDSPVYKIRCLGEFADVGENQLIALSWLEDARGVNTGADGSMMRKRITIDVADGGLDETVMIVSEIYDSKTRFMKMKRASYPSSRAVILAADAAERMWAAENMNVDRGDLFVVDGLGVGAGTAGELIERGYPVAVYKGGSTGSVNTTKYRCLRVKSYFTFQHALRAGQIEYDEGFCSDIDWEDYCAQACSIKKTFGGDKYEDLQTREQMRADGIKSPDMTDASVMRYYDVTPTWLSSRFEPCLIGQTANASYDGSLI